MTTEAQDLTLEQAALEMDSTPIRLVILSALCGQAGYPELKLVLNSLGQIRIHKKDLQDFWRDRPRYPTRETTEERESRIGEAIRELRRVAFSSH